MNYTVERISSIVKGEIINNSNKDLVVKDLLFDSRLLDGALLCHADQELVGFSLIQSDHCGDSLGGHQAYEVHDGNALGCT